MSDEARSDARAMLAEALFNDPEEGPKIREIIARKFPKTKGMMPDLVIREESEKTRAEIRKEREEWKREQDQERNQRALDRAREELLADPELKVRAEELPAIEKLMQDELIGTHKAAARLYRAQQVVAAPRGSSLMEVPGLNGAGGAEYKGLVENPDKWAREKAHEVISDFQKGQGHKWA